MNKILYDILDRINEGIVILNTNMEIVFWNHSIVQMTGITKEKAINVKIINVLPTLNKNYIQKLMLCVLNNGCKIFFSAALHENLINNRKVNLKVSKIGTIQSQFLLFEFIDVTHQFARITQLKKYVNRLYISNKKLKKQENVIKKLAYYDELTGVANRTLFYKIAEGLLSTAKRNNSLVGLLFLDVDKFKNINDKYGHKLGDKVLIEVAHLLKRCTRSSDVVARYGGDEFLVLLPIKKYEDYKMIASRIESTRGKTLYCGGKEVQISLSMGMSFYPHDGNSIDELILKADKAMYSMKNYRCKTTFPI